jgi:hypothetical protein
MSPLAQAATMRALARYQEEAPRFAVDCPPQQDPIVVRNDEEARTFVNGWIDAIRSALYGEETQRASLFYEFSLGGALRMGGSLAGLLYVTGSALVPVLGRVALTLPEESRAPALAWLSDFVGLYHAEIVQSARRERAFLI